MHKNRFLIIPLVMVFVMACGLTNGIQGIATQLPGILTSVPTAFGAVETLSAQQSSNNCPATPTAVGLGFSVYTAKSITEVTNQFTFSDGTENGKPVTTATLSTSAATTFPAIASGFSAQFIGDPCNVAEIKITIPRNDQQATVDQGIALVNLLLAGVVPPTTQLQLVAWMAEGYANMPVGGQQQTTINNVLFTMSRDQSAMLLDITPAK